MDTQLATPSYTSFRPTTASQRQLLFRTATETGNVSYAASIAHVGRGTYYYWRDRFDDGGYPALSQERSRAPHHFRIPLIAPAIIEEVKATKIASPQAGYRTVANEVCKAHGWSPMVGPTKVREIMLKDKQVTPCSQAQRQQGLEKGSQMTFWPSAGQRVRHLNRGRIARPTQ